MFSKTSIFKLKRFSNDDSMKPKDLHSLTGLKANITYDLNWVTKKLTHYFQKEDDKVRALNQVLNSVIIEYEITEKQRMTVREYLEKTGKMPL